VQHFFEDVNIVTFYQSYVTLSEFKVFILALIGISLITEQIISEKIGLPDINRIIHKTKEHV
jgi:predicted tellurium resistance membrane protein TerC